MTRVEINFVQRAVALGVDAAGAHECECSFDFAGHLFVSLTFSA